MPTTVPSDAPTWFITLEYLKVLLSPAVLIVVVCLVWFLMYLWKNKGVRNLKWMSLWM